MTTIKSNEAHRSTQKGSGQNKVPEEHPVAMPKHPKPSRYSHGCKERRYKKIHRTGYGYTVC